jgi:hypothetical protein
MTPEERKQWISDRLKLAWSIAEHADLELANDDNGVLWEDKEYSLVGWIVRYIPPFDKDRGFYADRKAVGFIVTSDMEETRIRLLTFQAGLDTLIRDFDKLAVSFRVGGELPKPLIGLLI